MFKRKQPSTARIDTLIGRNASVQGDIEFSGGLHIDGRVDGNVRAAQGAAAALSVSEHGLIDGSVQAPSVVLNGRVNGDITATDRVVLGAKARVQGNLYYAVIEMALGAEINGKLVSKTEGAKTLAEVAAAAVATAPTPHD